MPVILIWDRSYQRNDAFFFDNIDSRKNKKFGEVYILGQITGNLDFGSLLDYNIIGIYFNNIYESFRADREWICPTGVQPASVLTGRFPPIQRNYPWNTWRKARTTRPQAPNRAAKMRCVFDSRWNSRSGLDYLIIIEYSFESGNQKDCRCEE